MPYSAELIKHCHSTSMPEDGAVRIAALSQMYFLTLLIKHI